MVVKKDPATLVRLKELSRNCNLGKYRHFNASARAKYLSDILGIPVIIINIILGSAFFVTITNELSLEVKWVGGFLGIAGALISGVTTFFNFGKLFEGHRNVATKYVHISGLCENTIAGYRDKTVDLKELGKVLNELQDQYAEVNDEAKALPTNQKDFKVALDSIGLRETHLEKREKKINQSLQQHPD